MFSKFPHIKVMAASAGSGKTYALSKRYVDFLLSPEGDTLSRHILAVTFTNKAAGEMKERIIFLLKKIALEEKSEIKRTLAKKRLDQLLEKYSDFKVQTIDSFFTTVASSSALELNLSPYFEIILDPKPILSFVLDELLSQVIKGPLQEKKELKNAFLEVIDELFQIKQDVSWNIKQLILENFINLNKQRSLKGHKIKQTFSSQEVERERLLLNNSLEQFLKMNNYQDLCFKLPFVKAASKLIDERSYGPWESEMFLKDDLNEICKKGSNITPSHEKIWSLIRKEMALFTEMAACSHFGSFNKLTTLFDKELFSFKKRGQIIFIEDIKLKLREFLYKENIIPEVYFYLGEKTRHFFIDEFQDTSSLHWENLFPLIEEALAKGGSLFYAGDKKQAIYGFSGGKLSLFDEAKECFPSVPKENVLVEFSEINYRSRENIISFVNGIFSKENLISWVKPWQESINPSLILETYAHVQQKSKKKGEYQGGLVKVERISPNLPLKKEELEILVNLIQDNLIQRFSYRDMAILVRTNAEAARVTKVLINANIPVASEKTLNISSNSLIGEIISFLTFLDSPLDNFSFAGFISGNIFLRVSELTREMIFSFLLENRKNFKPLYILFRDKFPKIWEDQIEGPFQRVGFLPPYDLVSHILKRYYVFQNFPDEEGIFYQFLEVLKQSETEGKSSLKAFLEFWKDFQEKGEIFHVVLPAYLDAVKVYTIHKAKGLEFPIVIIPFAYLENKPINEVYEEDSHNFRPYRINQEKIRCSSKLTTLWQQAFTLQLIEELNAFYVSLTRAVDELYIFLPNYEKKRMSQKLPVPIILKEETFEVGYPLSGHKEVLKEEKKHHHPLLVHDWQNKLYRPHLLLSELLDAQRKRALEKGELIHNFLAKIEKLTKSWQEEMEERFCGLNQQEQEIIPLLRTFFSQEELRRWFLLPAEVKVYCEKEIVGANGLLYRVDRLLIFPEKVVIIEFKSGEVYSKKHKEQVADYLKFLSEIYSEKVVEGYLVYVEELKQEMVEWG
ncbi:MAG: UvrD-helicase domain-containing protein [bacterium]